MSIYGSQGEPRAQGALNLIQVWMPALPDQPRGTAYRPSHTDVGMCRLLSLHSLIEYVRNSSAYRLIVCVFGRLVHLTGVGACYCWSL